MADQSNYLLLTEATSNLREALRPYVETQLRAAGPGWWKDFVLPNVSPLSRGKLPDQPVRGDRALLSSLDLADLLQLIVRNWSTVFRARLGDAARAYAQELLDTRNIWAHKGDGDLGREQVERAIQTAALLLESVDRKSAASMRALLKRTEQDKPPASGATPASTEAAPARTSIQGLRSWRDLATPRADVRSGTLSRGQFAADLAEVASGNPEAGSEYLDPAEFFTRTYVTAGVRAFLRSALLRLKGTGGDAVVQLKTGFGGGKTHTMLALYHLAKGGPELANHEALRELFAEVGVLERTNVAVLVGTHIDPTTPYDDEPDLRSLGIGIKTLWGRMAWQLGGLDGYMLVRDADDSGVAPGAETLIKLFGQCAPCIVLIDEFVAFARKLPTSGRTRVPAGTFESNLSFIQSLTEAAKASPRTIVAASIPESDAELGGVQGRQVLQRIENTFGRIETPWTPVEALESFEVVRRRLFESVDAAGAEQTVAAFCRVYRDNATDFPVAARERAYEERMRRAFPFHPELFDRLYEDWNAAISDFQATRGVLRLMAGAVQHLWQAGDPAPLIMPGSLPLEAPAVRDELMRYLPRGYQPVIEGDIDGPGAEATEIDAQNPRFSRVGAARSTARTIFLGSVPGKATQGIEDTRVRLGAVRPGESISTYNDALGHLTRRLQFLYTSGSGRYWFDLRPNLTRTASDRMSRCTDEQVGVFLEERLKEDRERGSFAGKHVAPQDTADVPDDAAVRLVVLSPRYPHHAGSDDSPALRRAKLFLDSRGNAPRLHRNMLVFVAVDEDGLPALFDEARQHIAWESIVRDRLALNLDEHQTQTATKNRDDAIKKVVTDLRAGYRWAIAPQQSVRQVEGRWTADAEEWRTLDIASRGLESATGGIARRAGAALEAEERLLPAWSPLFLARELERWFWPQGLDHVSVKKLWEENLARYVYFPRLLDREVLAKAIIEAVTLRDYFGYAAGVEPDGRYVGLCIGRRASSVLFDSESVLVRRDVALAQADAAAAETAARSTGASENRAGYESVSGEDGVSPAAPPSPEVRPVRRPTRFYGTVQLNPLRIGSAAGQINDEIVKHLTRLVGSEVEVVLEVRAKVQDGISEALERTISENARQLKFQSFEFEEE